MEKKSRLVYGNNSARRRADESVIGPQSRLVGLYSEKVNAVSTEKDTLADLPVLGEYQFDDGVYLMADSTISAL